MKENQGPSKSKIPVIAVFDIGKTNKKIFLFDEKYKIVYEDSTQLPEIDDEDGFPCEDVQALAHWVAEKIRFVKSLEHVSVTAINVSAYGASFVHLDHHGKPIGNLYNYLKSYPDNIFNSFISAYDKVGSLSLQTSSPLLKSLNSGLQLYRLKHEKPSTYNQIRSSLHLPQFISFLLTGKSFTELTSIGCHTMLWDFGNKNYHDWVIKENLESKFPALVSSNHTTVNAEIKIGVGLHDSSAALIPYLKSFHDPFILISTGTWCITLNPFNQSPLTEEELPLDCLHYLSYEGNPVKASRLFSGYKHDLMVEKIATHFAIKPEYLPSMEFDHAIAKTLVNRESNMDSDKLGKQSSGFSQRNLSDFKSATEAYHQLLIDIVRQQIKSTGLVLKNANIKKIYVDGGFSNNSVYMNLLASGFPQHEVYGALVPQASALGAALAIHQSWNHYPIQDRIIQLNRYKRPDGIGIHSVI